MAQLSAGYSLLMLPPVILVMHFWLLNEIHVCGLNTRTLCFDLTIFMGFFLIGSVNGEYCITDVKGWVAENSGLGLLAQLLIQQL